MTVKLADAVVEVATDNSRLDKGLGEAKQKTTSWGSMLSGMLAGVGIAVANAAVGIAQSAVGQIGGLITSASDLGETVSKTNVLFGDSARAMRQWADTASSTFGQSKQQALDAATTFATFGKAAGVSGTELNGFAMGLTQLASDLASFNNATPQQAIDAIGAALRGETEPMRQFGVLLDDASMKAMALKMGLIETTKDALTPQQKVLAAHRLILEQTKDAQGDFNRTSDGYANSSRSFKASLDDIKATLGNALLPVVEAVMTALNNFAQVILPPLREFIETKIVPAVQKFGTTLDNFATVYGKKVAEWVMGVLDWFGKLMGGAGDVEKKGGASIGGLMKSVGNLVMTVGGAVVTILTELGKLYNWFLFNDNGELRAWAQVVAGIFGTIIDAVSLTIDWIARFVRALGSLLRGDIGGALNELTRNNMNTSGMVPLYDSNGNRIGWQTAEQAAINSGQYQQNQQTNNFTINIQGSGDPRLLARESKNGVQDALRAVGAQ